MKRKTRIVILFSFNLIYLLVGYGSTRYVTTTGGATTKDGRSWATAYQGLQAALTSAVSGDEIWVAYGTYHPTSAYSLTNSSRYYHFEMKNGVTIYGGLAGTETIISERTDYGHGGIHETILSGDIGIVGNNTDNCYHVFYHNALGLDATAKLDGFTITGGRIGFDYPHNGGGGMYNRGSCSPTITNCSFISNSAESAGDGYGGGILNNHSSPVIANCIFTSNYGDHGGGIYNEQSSPTITNCRFTSNSGYNGGGIFNSSSSPAITNCIFISNSVSNEGGGIFNFQGGSPIIVNCTFSLNSAALGGGLNNRVSSSPTLNNCIVWGNTATTKGNQFYIDGGGTSTLNYCCYANGPGDITVLNGTFTPDNNSVISDPLFVGPLVNPNHPYSIQGISPCADAGKDSYNSEMFDIRGKGYPRKLSKTSLAPGKIDIGAYEFNLYEGAVLNLVTLSSPGNSISPGYTISTTNPSFIWNGIAIATNYGLQLYKKNGSTYNLIFNVDNLACKVTFLPAGTITDGSQYYWQVRAKVDNTWMAYSAPFYFNVILTSLTPTIALSSNSIQSGETETISGTNFTKNNQATVVIASDNGYSKTLSVNTNNAGFFSTSLSLTTAGVYSIYCKDVSSGNTTGTKSFEVKAAGIPINFSIIQPSTGYKAYYDESLSIGWTDQLSLSVGYPISGSQRGYYYIIETSSDNGKSWQNTDVLIGYADINKPKTFNRVIESVFLPISNYLVRVEDGYGKNRTTPVVPIQIIPTTTPVVPTEFIWDYSYNNFTGSPSGVVTDGISRFYIKVSEPGKIITKVTFSLSDSDNNNSPQTLGKLMEASNIASYDEEANKANQLDVSITHPHTNNEFWCWYVAPDEFNGVNPSTNMQPLRQVNVNIQAVYSDGSTKGAVKKITISRPPVVLVHGLNSDPSMWSHFSDSPALSNYQIFRLKIGGQDSYENNAISLLGQTSSAAYSIIGVIKEVRKGTIACSQVDYIGHSMGGVVLRYAETYHSNLFFTKGNYNNGFIHKFITLDTPHKGSPFANWLESQIWAAKHVNNSLAENFGLDKFYQEDPSGFLSDVTPAIKNLKVNSYTLNQTAYNSHVFVGDMINGQENLASIPSSDIENLTISPTMRDALGFLLFYNPINGPGLKGFMTVFENAFINLSGNSISNSDFIVPLKSQLSDLSQSSSLATYTVNFHSEAVGRPSIEMNSAADIAALLEKPMSSAVWGRLPRLQTSAPSLSRKTATQIALVDTTKIQVLSPEVNTTLYVDSVLNLTFSIADTANLKKIMINYQDKIIIDTAQQTNYNYSLAVSNNYLDIQKISISALYVTTDSIIVSNKNVSVNIRSKTNPVAIKSEEPFVYLLKDENYSPIINIYFDDFIGKIGTTGTLLEATVSNSNIISFNSQTKKITAVNGGTAFAIINYQGLKDTIYFKVIDTNIKDTTILLTPMLMSPADSAINLPTDLDLKWKTSSRADEYIVQLSIDSSFSNIFNSDSSRVNSLKISNDLVPGMKYYWRVKAVCQNGESKWSKVWAFSTIALPVIKVNKQSIVFGDVKKNLSIHDTIQITNGTLSLLQVDSIYTRTNAFTIDRTEGTVGADTLKVIVSFTPTEFITYTDTLFFHNNSATSLVKIPIYGNSPRPVLAFTPSVYRRDTVAVGDSTSQIIVIKNFSINDLSYDSAFTKSIFFVMKGESKNIIRNNDSAMLMIVFKPNRFGEFTDTLSVGSLDPILRMPLTGSSPYPQLDIARTFLDFGNVMKDTLAMKNLIVKNSSINKLRIDSLKTSSKWFAVDRLTSPVFVSNKDSATIRVSFKPDTIMTCLDTLSIISNGKIYLVKIILSGNGKLTSVSNIGGKFPTEYAVTQNFPNPFNPSTIIQYDLPVDSHVKLFVFNVLGQQIVELINTDQPAGVYRATWNAGVSSGMYFYRLEATSQNDPNNRFVETKKMILMH